MKNIKTGTICSLISMVSVVVMLIWGFVADDFSRSWLAVLVGGVLSYGFYMIRRDIDNAQKDKEGSDNGNG